MHTTDSYGQVIVSGIITFKNIDIHKINVFFVSIKPILASYSVITYQKLSSF